MKKFREKVLALIIAVFIYGVVFYQINTSISNNVQHRYFAISLNRANLFNSNNIRQVKKYQTDSSSQNILLIGDSMSKWLRYRLQDYCEKNAHKLAIVTWVSGNTMWFAETDTLEYYINRFDASYVILVLGSNELFIKNIKTKRSKFVDKISEILSNIKWVWIGPPNWKNDTGINNMLIDKLGKDRFFLSKNLKFHRQKDGMHPTVNSCSMWVDSIASWVTNTSQSRILLDYPTEKRKILKPKALVLKPI